MAPKSRETPPLYATDHGRAWRRSDGRIGLSLGEREWTVQREEITTLHEAIETLAARVYRCHCDCRWQLRLNDHDVTVLETDDVLHLHSLLDGATAMLELRHILDQAAITESGVRIRGPRSKSRA